MSATRGENRTGVLSVKKEYPDPRTLPVQPSWQQARRQLTLSELSPGQYVSTTARIAYVKTSERTDALGPTRIAIMIDSPYHMYDQTRFSITEAGAEDVEEYKNSTSEW